MEEAAASLATATKRRSAPALAAMEPKNGATRPKEGRNWLGSEELEARVFTGSSARLTAQHHSPCVTRVRDTTAKKHLSY